MVSTIRFLLVSVETLLYSYVDVTFGVSSAKLFGATFDATSMVLSSMSHLI